MDFNTRLFWTLSGWTVLQLSGNPGNPKQQAHTGTNNNIIELFIHYIAAHMTTSGLHPNAHVSDVKHWQLFLMKLKQVWLVSRTLTLSSFPLCVLLHHVGLLTWRSEKGLQLCINSLTWISLLRLSGENQPSSRGACVSSTSVFPSCPIPLCVSPPAAGVGAWARLVEPPAGLCRGSGQGDRSHRQLSAPDLPGRRTGVGTTQPAAAGTVRLITQNHNLTEGWKDPLSVK